MFSLLLIFATTFELFQLFPCAFTLALLSFSCFADLPLLISSLIPCKSCLVLLFLLPSFCLSATFSRVSLLQRKQLLALSRKKKGINLISLLFLILVEKAF